MVYRKAPLKELIKDLDEGAVKDHRADNIVVAVVHKN